MAYVNNSVQRHMIADYIDISATSTPVWELMGTGFTSLNESPNAQVKSSKYINNPSATKTTTGYETQFPFTSEMIVSEKAIRKIYNVAALQKTGGDCEASYIRADLFNPSGAYTKTTDVSIDTAKTYYEKIDDEYYPVASPIVGDIGDYYEFAATANTFRARKFPVSLEVSSIDDSDGNIQISGNLNQAGLMVEGTFNTSTKTFTPNA